MDEWAAPGDCHQRSQHDVGYLVGVEGCVPLVDLDQTRDDGLGDPSTGAGQAHDQGYPTNCCMDPLAFNGTKRIATIGKMLNQKNSQS